MKKLRMVLRLCVLAFLVSCTGEEVAVNDRLNEDCSLSDCKFVVTNGGVVTDTSNDTEQSFIDFTQAQVIATDDNVSARLTVRNLPNQLTHNTWGDEPIIEYIWAAWFDVDNSLQYSPGDLIIELSYSNSLPYGEESAAALLSFAEASVFRVKDDISGSTRILNDTDIEKAVENNTIILTVDKSKNDELKQINTKTAVHFQSYHNPNDGNGAYRDHYPNP